MSVSLLMETPALPWTDLNVNSTTAITSVVNNLSLHDGSFNLNLSSASSVPLTTDKNWVFDSKNSNVTLKLDSAGTSVIDVLPGTHQLANLDSSQEMANKNFVALNTVFVDTSLGTKKARFECGNISGGATRVMTLLDSNQTLVGETASENLSNKSLESDSTNLYNLADPTKQLNFDLSNEGTNTKLTLQSNASVNQISIVPDQGGLTKTFLMDTLPQQVLRKSLEANTTQFYDNADNTKILQFDLSVSSPASTTIAFPQSASNVLTVPNATVNSNFVLSTPTQVSQLTNFGTTVSVPNGSRSFAIATQSASTAAGAQDTFIVNCGCVGTDQIYLSLRDYNGAGWVILSHGSVGAGSFTMRVRNGDPANALNAGMTINVLICS